MKCEFLTECGMCTMKSKAAEKPTYCNFNYPSIYKYLWTGEEIKNVIIKMKETKPTQHHFKKDIEAESEEEE